jgi:hypothetical protein
MKMKMKMKKCYRVNTLVILAISLCITQRINAQSHIPKGVQLSDKLLHLSTTPTLNTLAQKIRKGEEKFHVFQLDHKPNYFMLISHNRIENYPQIFVGNEDAFHQLKSVSKGRDQEKITWGIYDAHAVTRSSYQFLLFKSFDKDIQTDPPTLQPSIDLDCHQEVDGVKSDVKKSFKPLNMGEAQAVLSKVRLFEPIYTTHKPIRLFRDDWGVYYYIEENKSPQRAERYRLWMGYRGAMKLVPIITAAVDTEGLVLISKDAAMRLISKRSNQRSSHPNSERFGAFWTDTQTQKNLLEVPVGMNQGVIFNELGIYDQLYMGSFCDSFFNRSPTLLKQLIKPAAKTISK